MLRTLNSAAHNPRYQKLFVGVLVLAVVLLLKRFVHFDTSIEAVQSCHVYGWTDGPPARRVYDAVPINNEIDILRYADGEGGGFNKKDEINKEESNQKRRMEKKRGERRKNPSLEY